MDSRTTHRIASRYVVRVEENTPLGGGGESVAAAQHRERREGVELGHGPAEPGAPNLERGAHRAHKDPQAL